MLNWGTILIQSLMEALHWPRAPQTVPKVAETITAMIGLVRMSLFYKADVTPLWLQLVLIHLRVAK